MSSKVQAAQARELEIIKMQLWALERNYGEQQKQIQNVLENVREVKRDMGELAGEIDGLLEAREAESGSSTEEDTEETNDDVTENDTSDETSTDKETERLLLKPQQDFEIKRKIQAKSSKPLDPAKKPAEQRNFVAPPKWGPAPGKRPLDKDSQPQKKRTVEK